MPLVPLLSSAYQSRSIISGAQRCVNLIPELHPEDSQAPAPVTHYASPGTRLAVQLPDHARVRCVYRASNDNIYAVCGQSVYLINSSFSYTKIGSIGTLTSQVYMRDNGICVLLVDGSSTGYVIDLTAPGTTFGTIQDPNFQGADRVDYIDTYFILNVPGTNQWYLSNSNITYTMATTAIAGSAFNGQYVVAKSGAPDPVSSIICLHREAWIIGTRTSEVWSSDGAPDFPLGEIQGTFIDHGCIAKNSIASHDEIPFWLSQDKDGQGVVVMGVGYAAKRISTHEIEYLFSTYTTLSDAIGFVYQQLGHVYYVLTFPTQDVTWACEVSSGHWHQWSWSDQNGTLHRHRANCSASAFGFNLIGDWQDGSIYILDPNVFTDNGLPIQRIRTFPHLINDGKQVVYKSFIAEMQTGVIAATPFTTQGSGDFNQDFSNDFNAQYAGQTPTINLRWSDTRGASWGEYVQQQLGATGQYNFSIKWNRLGKARDRVFELSWSDPVNIALNGAFIEMQPCDA